MPTILPVDRPILYTVYGDGVLISDITRVGDLTGVNNALSVVSDVDENAYLAALAPIAKAFPPLPDSGWLEQGAIYQHDDGAVMVRQAHERTAGDPADALALFWCYQTDVTDVEDSKVRV